jgi:hypothetical protein
MRITDAGEKIGGARKDLWAGRGLRMDDLSGMTGSEVALYLTKEEVWPRPDYAALIATGVDPVAARLIKAAYDRLATKPLDYTEAGVSNFIKALTLLQAAAAKIVTVDDVFAAGQEYLASIGMFTGEFYRDQFGRLRGATSVETREATRGIRASVDRRYNNGGSPFGFTHYEIRKAERAVAEGWPGRKTVRVVSAGAKPLPVRPHLDKVTRSGADVRHSDVGAQAFIDALGFRGVEFGHWVADDERQRVVNLAYDALHDLASVMGVTPTALSLGGKLAIAFGARGVGRAAAHYEGALTVVNMTKLAGAGALAHEFGHALDHYLGEVFTAAPYSGATKWASGYRSKTEYAPNGHRLTNLPEEVSRAFDAVMIAINEYQLTADEMISSAEDRIAKIDTRLETATGKEARKLRNYRLNNERIIKNLRSGEGFRTTRQTNYLQEAIKIGGKTSNNYWKRPTELFARAFECWVFDKLAERGAHADYLVHGVEEGRYSSDAFRGNPYPMGDERARINAAFDELLTAIHRFSVLPTETQSVIAHAA